MTIGEVIKDYCDRHQISQRAFALRAGMSNGYISQLCRGTPRKGVDHPASVQAGLPLEAVENIVDYEEISPNLQGEYFALRIKGDSMTPRICEGDVVIVKKQPDVESGSVAIILVNGYEATVKKVIKGRDYITLIGFNPSFEPITYTKQEIETLPVQIIGKVIEIRGKL